MIHIVMMVMLALSVMATASVRSTIASLKISTNYLKSMQRLYQVEGHIEQALHALKTGQDRDLDGVEDFHQVHGNGDVLVYLIDGVEVMVERDPNDPQQATITVEDIVLTVNNFPGGGQSCQNNNQCTPERVAWEN